MNSSCRSIACLDNDPWGYYIYSVIKQGSINLAFESQRMAIPDAASSASARSTSSAASSPTV